MSSRSFADAGLCPGDDVLRAPNGVEWSKMLPEISRTYLDYEVARRVKEFEPEAHFEFAIRILSFGPGFEHYAIEALMRYVGLMPEEPGGYLCLGFAFTSLGAERDAAIAYEQAVAVADDNSEEVSALIWSYLMLRAGFTWRWMRQNRA
jgi:hypothetical protein